MPVDHALVDAAKAQAVARFPEGEAGAAAVYLSDESMLTSVGFDAHNHAAVLCHETGALCEAFRRNVAVTASVCVVRPASDQPFMVLAPCGICQERLALWADGLEVAVPLPDDPSNWQSLPSRAVQPHYWANVFTD